MSDSRKRALAAAKKLDPNQKLEFQMKGPITDNKWKKVTIDKKCKKNTFDQWLRDTKIISKGALAVGTGIGALAGNPAAGAKIGSTVGGIAGNLGYGSMYSPYLAKPVARSATARSTRSARRRTRK